MCVYNTLESRLAFLSLPNIQSKPLYPIQYIAECSSEEAEEAIGNHVY